MPWLLKRISCVFTHSHLGSNHTFPHLKININFLPSLYLQMLYLHLWNLLPSSLQHLTNSPLSLNSIRNPLVHSSLTLNPLHNPLARNLLSLDPIRNPLTSNPLSLLVCNPLFSRQIA